MEKGTEKWRKGERVERKKIKGREGDERVEKWTTGWRNGRKGGEGDERVEIGEGN